MNPKTILTLFVIGFCVFCGVLVIESGLFDNDRSTDGGIVLLQNTSDEEAEDSPSLAEQINTPKGNQVFNPEAYGGIAKKVILGAAEPILENPETGYKLQLELSSQGAAIYRAIFSDGQDKGFDDRNYKDPQPLAILTPVTEDILSMANKEFVFVDDRLQVALDKLHWKSLGILKGYDGTESASFEAVIKEVAGGKEIVRLTKTYKVTIGSYMVDCSLKMENLSGKSQRVRFNMAGPVGIGREGSRADMRKIVGGFMDSKGEVTSMRLPVTKFDGKLTYEEKPMEKDTDKFLWSAITNKYFAAILIPTPEQGKDIVGWVTGKTGRFYNPDGDKKGEDEQLGVNLKVAAHKLAAVGDVDSAKTFNFQLYLGPKDKRLFDKNEQYKSLGFVQTIDFLACCCPASIIGPLAFGILGAMEWLYSFIPNYGVVIIILVFIIRLCLHPVTKKSQVSMSKMQKMGPMVAELKKKYGNNKAELHKHTMALYKEQGVSPIKHIWRTRLKSARIFTGLL